MIGRRALGLVATLGLVLGACTTTVPDARGPAGSDPAAETGNGGAAAAPAQVRLLNMQDVSAALSDTDDVEVHVDLEVTGMGETVPAMRFTTTTDSANGRFSYRSEPVDFSDAADGETAMSIPGYEMIGQQTDDGMDLYLRADGEDGWVRLVVDASLTGETEVFQDPGQILESFDLSGMPGLTFTEDGTGTHAGETMTRQVATLDFLAMLDEAMPQGSPDDSDELADLMKGMFEGEELTAFLPTGTIELLVDGDATPRRIDIELSMGAGTPVTDEGFAGFSGSMRTTMTIDPAPDGGITLPAADDVTETIAVDSSADFADALGELSGALDWN